MSLERKTALALMVVLGLFIAATVGVLVRTFDREIGQGLLTSPTMTQYKAKLAESPKDDALKAEIRAADARLRTEYFTARRRFSAAGWALLVAGAAWLASARWFVAGGARRLPSVLAPGFVASRRRELSRARRHAAWTGGALTAALFAWMVWYGAVRQPLIAAPGETTALAQPAPNGTHLSPTNSGPSPIASTSSTASIPPTAWPGFRGPGNLGLAGEGKWPTTWTVGADGAADANVLWKSKVPVAGKSSPIVWGGRVFLTGGDKAEQRIVCYDLNTGALLWNTAVRPPADAEPGDVEPMEDTGFAAPTPATDGERVFALFATGLLAACDFAGNQVWSRGLGAPESMYGFASSPIVVGQTLVVQYDQGSDPEASKSALLGFDCATGKPLWTVPREVPNSWSSPAVIAVGAKQQIVTCAQPWVIAYDATTAREVWKIDPLSGDVAPSPAFANGVLYVTNTGSKTVALRPATAPGAKPEEVWTADEDLPDTSSPVCDGKYLLMSAPGGNLTCWDAAAGKKLWDHALPSNATASPILAGGRAYFALEDGSVVVVQPGDAYQEVSRNEMGEPLYATPAFVRDSVVLRGKSHLFRIGEKP